MTKEEWKQLALECDGCEVPEPDWPTAELLEPEGFTLGPPRGPGRSWRRLRPPEGENE